MLTPMTFGMELGLAYQESMAGFAALLRETCARD